ncbi:hypothetical protein ACHWQZ_G006297 [Mnemiopsis leidyi]
MCKSKIELLLAKGRKSIFVQRELLISESTVFCRLIDELGFTQIPIQDFDPDNVRLFVDLLEVGNRENFLLNNVIFRELHKIGVVFDTQWLVNFCLDWLTEEMKSALITTDFDEKLFLFEECFFILSKLKRRAMMDLFIQTIVRINDHFFISRYLMDVDSREKHQLDLMLLICGTNSQVFIEILIRNIAVKNSLTKNIQYLLQKMNLAVCYEQNAELYQEMFDMLSNLPGLNFNDQSFLFKTFRESIKYVTHRRTSEKIETVVYSREEMKNLMNMCKSEKDVIESVKNGRVNCMFKIVILLVLAAQFDNFFSMETRVFVSQLTKTSATKLLKKVSFEFLDMVIAAVMSSKRPEKENVVEILELVKCAPELSSVVENDHLQFQASKIDMLYNSRLPFKYRHPGLPNTQECRLPGRCGFIMQGKGIGSVHSRCLAKQPEDYIGTGIHYHDLVCAEDMFYYKTWHLKLEDGTTVEVPNRWRWASTVGGSIWAWWLPPIAEISIGKYCVAVNVQKYLVGKDADEIFRSSK